MDIDLVLAPVDGSERAERAAEYAVAVAAAYDADLHLLFVLEETLLANIETGDVAAEAVAEDHRAFADDVRERLAERGHDARLGTSSAGGFSTTQLRQSPGSTILDAAEELGAEFLVVPREPGSDRADEAIGRAALYVIEYASQPVLSV